MTYGGADRNSLTFDVLIKSNENVTELQPDGLSYLVDYDVHAERTNGKADATFGDVVSVAEIARVGIYIRYQVSIKAPTVDNLYRFELVISPRGTDNIRKSLPISIYA
jgi:hypothetical protein